MKRILIVGITILLGLVIVLCGLLYFLQERFIFFPEKLSCDHRFNFEQPFDEINFKTRDNVSLNGILFKSDSSNGLIFYLHGNAGSLDSWGGVAKTYTDLHYDVLVLDYRGFGKSEGKINSQGQLFQDVQIVYDEMKRKYEERRIIVIGYSIGTGLAAKISSINYPRLLILQAPYFSLTDVVKHAYPFIPTFLLKYKLETNQYIKVCKMPVVIFHGSEDEVIYYHSSIKLKGFF